MSSFEKLIRQINRFAGSQAVPVGQHDHQVVAGALMVLTWICLRPIAVSKFQIKI
jgi:hypothetical protein